MPHGGDSDENSQYTIFNIKKKITLNYPKSAAMDFFSRVLKNELETAEFEIAVVNELSGFEPPKFYCIVTETASLFRSAWSVSYEAGYFWSLLFKKSSI